MDSLRIVRLLDKPRWIRLEGNCYHFRDSRFLLVFHVFNRQGEMIVFAPLFVLYSILAGITEGILFSLKGSFAFKWNIHAVFVSSRIVFALIFMLPNNDTVTEKAVTVAFWLLCHSFFHDGAYFETRRRIDVPFYRWYYNKSNTSTAHWEIPFLLRSGMAFVGIIGFAFYMLMK